MAKMTYKIPASIKRSYGDQEINFLPKTQSKGIPLKVIFFWIGSAFLLGWLIQVTFIKAASWYLIALFVIWWVIASVILGSYKKTKELKLMQIPALVEYLPKSARKVFTRTSSNPNGFASIVGIKDVSKDGLITWFDNSVGRAFLVVGSASLLLFDEDRNAILDRVDSYWRKSVGDCQQIIMTTKEPQRIYQQLANLDRRNLALEVDDPDLLALFQEQYDILANDVGDRFKSIHQYIILKADNPESLTRQVNILKLEAEESSLLFRGLSQLNGDDTLSALSVFYKGRN